MRAYTSSTTVAQGDASKLNLSVFPFISFGTAFDEIFYGIDNLIARNARLTHNFAARHIASMRRRYHAHGRPYEDAQAQTSQERANPCRFSLRRIKSLICHLYSFLGVYTLTSYNKRTLLAECI